MGRSWQINISTLHHSIVCWVMVSPYNLSGRYPTWGDTVLLWKCNHFGNNGPWWICFWGSLLLCPFLPHSCCYRIVLPNKDSAHKLYLRLSYRELDYNKPLLLLCYYYYQPNCCCYCYTVIVIMIQKIKPEVTELIKGLLEIWTLVSFTSDICLVHHSYFKVHGWH